MQYQLVVNSDVVILQDNGMVKSIPADASNTDWQEYQRWLAEGNTPEPADE